MAKTYQRKPYKQKIQEKDDKKIQAVSGHPWVLNGSFAGATHQPNPTMIRTWAMLIAQSDHLSRLIPCSPQGVTVRCQRVIVWWQFSRPWRWSLGTPARSRFIGRLKRHYSGRVEGHWLPKNAKISAELEKITDPAISLAFRCCAGSP